MTRKEYINMCTPSDSFQESWEFFLASSPSLDYLHRVLEVASPHHPNPNMVWLYDRVLYYLAGVSLNA